MEKKPARRALSNGGMTLVNVLFFLALCSRSPTFIICTYTVWALVLVRFAKKAESRFLRVFYALLGLYAMVMVGVQTVFLFRA